MGTKKHCQVQANITKLIGSRYDETLNPLAELTTRLREGQFYVPDLAIEELAKPIQGRYAGPNGPVLLCVEIVSPPDRVGKIGWEYFPEDVEPRKISETLTAGSIQLELAEVFRRVYLVDSVLSAVFAARIDKSRPKFAQPAEPLIS